MLLGEGFAPRRTVYLAFGHDEEVGGMNGALAIAETLESRGVEFEYVLDEGGIITDALPMVEPPVALIGIAEKGFTSLELSVRTEGGHSSMPPPQTAVGILSAAVDRLQKNPFPAGIQGAAADMFDYLMPEMPFGQRFFLANGWLFGPFIERKIAATPDGNAMMRTTTAPTIFHAGVKENVLPSSAKAVVNFRIRPGETVETVIEYVRSTIGDPRIEITPLTFRSDPSPVSDTESESFATLHRTIRQVFPDVIVAPYLVMGGTDSRYFSSLSPNVYRFGPFEITSDDLGRFHATDERLAVEACGDMVRFYVQLLRNSAS
jgi:carboxypeptidase PM20D1